MAKAKGGGKLHRLPFRTFDEIAALGFEIEVHARPRLCRAAPTLQGTRICLHQAGGAPAGWRRADADLPVLPPMRAPLVH
jgi:hypothetical protein